MPSLVAYSPQQYLLADCLRLRFLFHLLYQEGALELSRDATRFLIFTNWPMTCWLVEMFLSGLGVDFVVINASMTAEHRSAMVEKFNDPDSTVRVLLTTFSCGSLGLNLHSQCSRVVLLETPLNHNATIQTLGRVHRLGQTRQQRAWILFQDHTIQRYVEYNATKKMLAQLAGDYRLYLEEMSDDDVSVEDRSYKLLAQILGHHPLAPDRRHMEDYTELGAPRTKDEAPPPVKSPTSTNSEDSSDTQDFKSPKSNPFSPPQHTQTPGRDISLSDNEPDSDLSPPPPTDDESEPDFSLPPPKKPRL